MPKEEQGRKGSYLSLRLFSHAETALGRGVLSPFLLLHMQRILQLSPPRAILLWKVQSCSSPKDDIPSPNGLPSIFQIAFPAAVVTGCRETELCLANSDTTLHCAKKPNTAIEKKNPLHSTEISVNNLCNNFICNCNSMHA